MEPNKSNCSLRERKPLDYNESDSQALEQEIMHDSCYIKVSGPVYQKWKVIRDKLGMQDDEEMVVHLLNAFQNQ